MFVTRQRQCASLVEYKKPNTVLVQYLSPQSIVVHPENSSWLVYPAVKNNPTTAEKATIRRIIEPVSSLFYSDDSWN
ncbi:MAG: hypothetical protein J7K88_07920 [Candidatus Fermentibacteraceae bacterium]|nr:hypothetical protein [Candidatus Fermentibacteraceae bacterium]